MSENHQNDPGTAPVERSTFEPLAQVATQGSCCGSKRAAAPAAQGLDNLAECPVMMGTPVNKAQAEAAGLYRDHNGQRYWFCCAACAPMWDADLDEYAAV